MTEWTQTKHHGIEVNQDGGIRIHGIPRKGKSSIFVYEETKFHWADVIWETFNGPIPHDKRIRFIDNNPLNRALDNLALHEKRALHYRISPIDRVAMVKRHRKGESIADLARCFEISESATRRVINEHFRA